MCRMSEPRNDAHGVTDSKVAEGVPETKPAEKPAAPKPKEVGGPAGPEPTRYGDWERKGRVSDF
jgi:hypothetical protein